MPITWHACSTHKYAGGGRYGLCGAQEKTELYQLLNIARELALGEREEQTCTYPPIHVGHCVGLRLHLGRESGKLAVPARRDGGETEWLHSHSCTWYTKPLTTNTSSKVATTPSLISFLLLHSFLDSVPEVGWLHYQELEQLLGVLSAPSPLPAGQRSKMGLSSLPLSQRDGIENGRL